MTMVAKLAKLPRWIYGLLLVASLLGMYLVTFPLNSEKLDPLPLEVLPAKYWLYLGLELVILLAFAVSLHYLLNPTRNLSSSIAVIGYIGALNLLIKYLGNGWTGKSVWYGLGTVVYFAIALVVWKLERTTSKQARTERS